LQCIFIGRSNNLWAEVHYIWNWMWYCCRDYSSKLYGTD
jgi:hypothetical protein